MNVAVVTTHNEAATIGPLVRALDMDVVVVDEHSTDATTSIAHVAGAMVLAHEGGIGPCQRRGWRAALSMGADRIVQIDAGGSHDPADVPRLLADDAELVIGSRFCPGGSHEGPRWRSYGSRVYAAAANRRYGQSIADWTSGFRVFDRMLASDLLHFDYTATMHGWQAEALAAVVDIGAKVAEVPIRYTPSASSLKPRVIAEAIRVLA